MYFPDRGCVRTLRTLYVYATAIHAITITMLCFSVNWPIFKAKKDVYSSSWNLRDWSVTCHTGSHSVTCHRTQVSVARLNRSSMQAGTRFTYPGGMEGWVYLVTRKRSRRESNSRPLGPVFYALTTELPRLVPKSNLEESQQIFLQAECTSWMDDTVFTKYLLLFNYIQIFMHRIYILDVSIHIFTWIYSSHLKHCFHKEMEKIIAPIKTVTRDTFEVDKQQNLPCVCWRQSVRWTIVTVDLELLDAIHTFEERKALQWHFGSARHEL